ncbi:MAG: PIN domain-containing protein [Anaerolineales bacterium]
MAAKPSMLIDLNILLDMLQKREPFYEISAALLAAMETGRVKGYVAAHSITTLFYLIRRDRSAAEARATITNLMQFIKIAPVNQSTIEQALNLDYGNYEDAVQMISAVQCKADYLITRNVKDYQPALVTVLKPVEFIGTLRKEESG